MNGALGDGHTADLGLAPYDIRTDGLDLLWALGPALLASAVAVGYSAPDRGPCSRASSWRSRSRWPCASRRGWRGGEFFPLLPEVSTTAALVAGLAAAATVGMRKPVLVLLVGVFVVGQAYGPLLVGVGVAAVVLAVVRPEPTHQ